MICFTLKREDGRYINLKLFIIVFAISLTMNVLLGAYAERQNLMYADIEINSEKNIVPDEKTAIEIASMYIDANLDWEECREGESYCSGVSFDELRNEWRVVFPRTSSSGMRILDSGYAVYIRETMEGYIFIILNSILYGQALYTIVEVKVGKGSKAGWGRLKSGAGWISLDYCQRV